MVNESGWKLNPVNITVILALLSWTGAGLWKIASIGTSLTDDERRISSLESTGQVKLEAIQGAITDVQVKLATMQQQVMTLTDKTGKQTKN